MRWFVDTNNDNKLDRWCYFSQGVETYREIDSDFDRVAELIVEVLSNTEAEGSSKAKYKLADGTADRVHAAAGELLAANPLYPGLTL